MKTTNILLISLVLLSMLGMVVTVDAAPRSQSIPAAQAPTTSVHVVQQEKMRPPPFYPPPSSITLTTSNSTPHIGQTFTLSGKFSVSNCSSSGFAALELYRSVNDGGYALFCTLTTQADGTFSKNLTYNTAATLKYYAVYDGGIALRSQSNIVTVTVTKAT